MCSLQDEISKAEEEIQPQRRITKALNTRAKHMRTYKIISDVEDFSGAIEDVAEEDDDDDEDMEIIAKTRKHAYVDERRADSSDSEAPV